MQADVLLTLKLQQRLFADPRRIALLKQIAQTGSISQGAKLAGISYKSAWDAINAMNDLSEHTLVERATGGKGGGGASLTAYGTRLVQLYDLLTQIQQNAFNALSDDRHPLDSLLTALARVSLQTSARNQWFGTVIARPGDGLQPHVAIMLDDGATRINAAVTAYSAQRLSLQPGKAVQVLIKAPWVTLSRDPDAARAADNRFSGIVSRIDTQGDVSEVLVTLPGGHTLCATLSAADLAAAAPEEGAAITAFFNADRVILATLC